MSHYEILSVSPSTIEALSSSLGFSWEATSSMDALSCAIFSIRSCFVASGSFSSSSRNRGSFSFWSSPSSAFEICAATA
jgi:hypothetical protein